MVKLLLNVSLAHTRYKQANFPIRKLDHNRPGAKFQGYSLSKNAVGRRDVQWTNEI